MSSRTVPTLRDVAAKAGVAPRTVSRVVNGEPNVSAETVKKVREAIKALNFRLNFAARALRSNRAFIVAILSNNPSPHYVADVVRGVSKVCREKGTFLTLEEFAADEADIANNVADLVDSIQLAGAILVPPLTDEPEVLNILEARNIPMVRISPAGEFDRTDAVFVRDGDGVRQLVQHLCGLGYRRFAIVSGPASHSSARIRMEAFKAALVEHGIDLSTLDVAEGDYTYASGARAARALLSRHPDTRPDVICAANDEMAAGVISTLGSDGIAVPSGIAVTGFDDSEIARMIWPPLTTIRQSIVEQAEAATRLLFEPVGNQGNRRHIEQDVELVIRTSTRPPTG